MSLGHSPRIVTDSLALCLDAADPKSYGGSGTTWFDRGVNGYDGTLINSPSYINENGGAFRFNGTNNYIDLGDVLDITGSFSLEIWFRSAASQPDTFCGIFTKDESGDFGNYGLFGGNPSEYVRFGFEGPNSVQEEISNDTYLDLLAEEWVHYVGTYDFNNLKLYRNSVLIAEAPTTEPLKTNSTNLAIGTRLGNGNEFAGDVAIARIYLKGLSQPEVIQNFNTNRGRFGL